MTAQDQLGPYTLVGKLTHSELAISCAVSVEIRPRLSRLAAVHLIDPSLLANDAFNEQLLERTRLATLLRHPNVVEVFDYAERDGVHYLVTEFAQGIPLSSLVGHPQLTPAMAAYIISQATVGVAHAHTRRNDDGQHVDIVHGDIRPDHIWISDNGAIKIDGFALGGARSHHHPDPVDPALQDRNLYAFADPTRARNETPTDVSDVFSLAAILWSIIADRPLFAGTNAADVRAHAQEGQVPDIASINPDIDTELARIIMRALGTPHDGEQVIDSAQTLRTQLSAWLRAQHAKIGRPEVKSAFEDVLTLPDILTAQRPMASREFKADDPFSKIHEGGSSDNDAMTLDLPALIASAGLLENGSSLSRSTGSIPSGQVIASSQRPKHDSQRVEATTQIVDSISAAQSQNPNVSLKPPQTLGREPSMREDLATVQVNAIDAIQALPPSLRNKPAKPTAQPQSKTTGDHPAAVQVQEDSATSARTDDETTIETPSADAPSSAESPALQPPETIPVSPVQRGAAHASSKPTLPPSTNPNLKAASKPSSTPALPPTTSPTSPRTGTQLISKVDEEELLNAEDNQRDEPTVPTPSVATQSVADTKVANARKGTQLLSPERFDEDELNQDDDASPVKEPSIRLSSLTGSVAAIPTIAPEAPQPIPQDSTNADEQSPDIDDDTPEDDAPATIETRSLRDAPAPSSSKSAKKDYEFDPTAIYDEETRVPEVVEHHEYDDAPAKKKKINPAVPVLTVIILALVAFFVYDRLSNTSSDDSATTVIPAALTVQSNPGRAKIFMNNEDTGMVTPYTFVDLDADAPVSIRVIRSGYEEVSGKSVSLKSGETSTVNFDLEALKHTINFSTEPEGATVYLDGEEIAEKTPTIVGPFEADPALGVNLVIRMNGYKPKSIHHTWKADERTSDVNIVLEKR